MKTFHGTFRGWLAQRIPGNKLFLLGLFLVFYLALTFGPSSIVPEGIRKSGIHAKTPPASDSLDVHVWNENDLREAE